MKNIYLVLIAFSAAFQVEAQTTLVLQPGSTTGSESEINNYPSNVNNNYGNYGVISSYIWANGSNTISERALLQFNLSSIPVGAIITSAYLDLYAAAPGNTFGGVDSTTIGTNNASYVQRVTQPWNSGTVTWNSQPNTTTVDQIILPTSTWGMENYHSDVTQLVKDMIVNGNNGFMISPISATPNNSMLFNSCNFSDTTLSPKLTVIYTYAATGCITLRPGPINGMNSEINSYPSNVNNNYDNYGVIGSYIWANGTTFNENSLLQFDLSFVPSNAVVTSAELDLYADSASTTFSTGVAMYGTDNASYLQRITQVWHASTVTWNNQPTTTTTDQVILPTSTLPNQNYLGINVAQLVQDMLTYGNNGFMISPVSTAPNNSMIFRSCSYADSSYWPELRVCYTVGVGVNTIQPQSLDVAIYPNPFGDQFTIKSEGAGKDIEVSVCNVLGQNIFRKTIGNPTTQITITRNDLHNADGLLFVTVSSNSASKTFKLISSQ